MDSSVEAGSGAEQLQSYFDSVTGGSVAEAAAGEPGGSSDVLIQRIGHLTRNLHDSLRGLGYDKVIEKTAAAIPDARDRLTYVISMTEQAAVRTLNSIDVVKPLQDDLAHRSGELSLRWDRLFAREMNIEEFKQLVADTRSLLREAPETTATTNAHLMDIMMAQDFQDLTGQVIKRITEIIHMVEDELLKLLLESIPRERRAEAAGGLMNGPVVNSEGRSDVVTSQGQVDDLLESLGF